MKLLSLYLIELTAFLLIIAETFIFFTLIVPLGAIPHSLTEYTALALLKLGLTAALGVLWFVVMIGLTRLYVRSKIPTPPRL